MGVFASLKRSPNKILLHFIDLVHATVAWLFTEYDVARGIPKFQYQTWEFRATSYSVNSQAIILTIIWLMVYNCLTKSWKFDSFAGCFLVTIVFWHRYQSSPDFSELNNDADLMFIAAWQQMGFSNMANLFDLDGGPYSYLDFKTCSLSNF